MHCERWTLQFIHLFRSLGSKDTFILWTKLSLHRLSVWLYWWNSILLVFSGFFLLLLCGSCPEQQSTHLQGFRCTYPNTTSFSLMIEQEQTKKKRSAFLTVSCTLLRVLSIELCFSIFKMSILSVTLLTCTLTLRLLYDLKPYVALNHSF